MADTTTVPRDAETWLRSRYGAYRGHFAWRELEEAFNAGRRAQPAPAASSAPLTRQQLREAYHRSTGCTLGKDIHHAERVCSIVEQAHGIAPVAASARLGTNPR